MAKYLYTGARLEPPEDRTVCTCAYCKGDIYETEHVYMGDNGYICPDCLREQAQTMGLDELAERLGFWRVDDGDWQI